MKLLTKALRKKLPPFSARGREGDEAIVHTKFFLDQWTWYVLEGEPVLYDNGEEQDFEFFGLVDGLKLKFGYFTLKELKRIRGKQGLPIERDRHWEPKTLGEVKRENNLS